MNLLSRTSIVDYLHIKTVSFSSTIQLGDSSIINGFSRVLAVQRESDTFLGTEGVFEEYAIFKEPIPLQPINENMISFKNNLTPCIKVGKIDVIAVSTTGLIHVGSSCNVYMETRVKHIRQLKRPIEDSEE
ncbi:MULTISPECIES: spore germination protein GerPE [unclassified Bacillus (in: firmicutes)]|uniref:spore germination protein GerPE n=1 Tax=unclassified Bacillus (in: firmicutes) TaxID=185979 RepID=UPI0008E1CED0|nr:MULTISPECIES: spore germination protein GerPE [unclassified Bacillus (in: firmicutes)]SFA79473.1 spore germination protein PE [Bacillus sp. UNCCL13]SFQ69496.1 spore germination protein PE [Bacillus sp. cl95]